MLYSGAGELSSPRDLTASELRRLALRLRSYSRTHGCLTGAWADCFQAGLIDQMSDLGRLRYTARSCLEDRQQALTEQRRDTLVDLPCRTHKFHQLGGKTCRRLLSNTVPEPRCRPPRRPDHKATGHPTAGSPRCAGPTAAAGWAKRACGR